MTDMFKFKRQPSFNGLPFFMSKVDRGGHGRKFETHEFPHGRKPVNEDLATNVGKYTVSGYLIGFDAVEQAKAIGAACDLPGAGILVLPDEPFNNVRCSNFSYGVEKEVANMATINFDFVVEEENIGGVVVVMVGRLLEIGLGKIASAMGSLGGGLNG